MWAWTQNLTHGSGVALRLVAAALDLPQRGVVGVGVAAQVFLDGDEFGGEHTAARQYQRLNDPRDTSIAVAEAMHAHQVEVGHRGSHGHVRRGIPPLQPLDELGRQLGQLLVGGPMYAAGPPRAKLVERN